MHHEDILAREQVGSEDSMLVGVSPVHETAVHCDAHWRGQKFGWKINLFKIILVQKHQYRTSWEQPKLASAQGTTV